MANHEAMYYEMLRASSEANVQLTKIAILAQQASLRIIKAQQKCEDIYIESAEDEPEE